MAAAAPAVQWVVYCLATAEEPIKTYVGATIDLKRRLRQHNQEIVGGARATSVRYGEWYCVCYVSGFQTQQQALSFEWHWKWFSRKCKKSQALERRNQGLQDCLEWSRAVQMPPLTVQAFNEYLGISS